MPFVAQDKPVLPVVAGLGLAGLGVGGGVAVGSWAGCG